jgi:hypothetical protein
LQNRAVKGLNSSLYSPDLVILQTYLILNGSNPVSKPWYNSWVHIYSYRWKLMWLEGRYHIASREVSQVRCIEMNWDFGLLACFLLAIKIATVNKILLSTVARMWRLYKTGIGLTTGFIRSHSYTTRLQCITLYNSQQLSPFSSSEDSGSNSATTGCNLLLWHPLPSLVITDSELSHHGCRRPIYIAREQTTNKTPSPIPLLLYVITGTDPKENNSSFHCCVA